MPQPRQDPDLGPRNDPPPPLRLAHGEEAVPVIAATSTAANVSCIAGGIIVFGDPMPGDTLGMAVQALAFVLVIVAAALTPAPMRAASAQPA